MSHRRNRHPNRAGNRARKTTQSQLPAFETLEPRKLLSVSYGYFGGSEGYKCDDDLRAAASGPDGQVYIAGRTSVEDLPGAINEFNPENGVPSDKGWTFRGLIASINPDGTLAWSRYIEEPGANPDTFVYSVNSLVVTDVGIVAIYSSREDLGGDDYYIACIDFDGRLLWSEEVTGLPYQGYYGPEEAFLHEDGLVYVNFESEILKINPSSEGLEIVDRHIPELRGKMEFDGEGNLYVYGTYEEDDLPGSINEYLSITITHSGDHRNGFIAKYDSTGELLWSRYVSEVASLEVMGLEVDSHGDVYTRNWTAQGSSFEIAPSFTGDPTETLVKFDGLTGELIWSESYSGSDSSSARWDSMLMSDDDQLYIVGPSSGYDRGVRIASYDAGGNFVELLQTGPNKLGVDVDVRGTAWGTDQEELLVFGEFGHDALIVRASVDLDASEVSQMDLPNSYSDCPVWPKSASGPKEFLDLTSHPEGMDYRGVLYYHNTRYDYRVDTFNLELWGEGDNAIANPSMQYTQTVLVTPMFVGGRLQLKGSWNGPAGAPVPEEFVLRDPRVVSMDDPGDVMIVSGLGGGTYESGRYSFSIAAFVGVSEAKNYSIRVESFNELSGPLELGSIAMAGSIEGVLPEGHSANSYTFSVEQQCDIVWTLTGAA